MVAIEEIENDAEASSPAVQDTEMEDIENMEKSDEKKRTFIIYNSAIYPSPPTKFNINIDESQTIKKMRKLISKETKYSSDIFNLVWKGKTITEADNMKTVTEVFGDLQKKCTVTIIRKSGTDQQLFLTNGATQQPKKVTNGKVSDDKEDKQSGNSTVNSTITNSTNNNRAMTTWGGSSMNDQYADKSDTGFIGLSNQGATCYMNSLIQTLFMTPEFRQALFEWNFDEKYEKDFARLMKKKKMNCNVFFKMKILGLITFSLVINSIATKEAENTKTTQDNEKETENGTTENENVEEKKELTPEERKIEKAKFSIPLQLQKLFARLQLSDCRAIKTKDLTKSFGWSESDAFTQHDVQELCRVLFDALEKNFKHTNQANLVNELYQGEMKDYVQCKECNYESARLDKYLDIPLVIRGFGESQPAKSIEEALKKFITPEVLDGGNQYFCEKCDKKVDALKGLKFVDFPYLLTLQLKRFDFDYETMRRIKVNDKVTFPQILDLNPFISGDNPGSLARRASLSNIGKTDTDTDMDELLTEPTEDKPYVYELYSILIHRGSAMGGHYYAYIKTFESGKWFNFNDSVVNEIDEDEIEKTFGEDEKASSSSANPRMMQFKSSANAYMLMYRRIDKKNVSSIHNEEISQHITDMIEEENEAHKKKKEEKEMEKEMIKLKIFYLGTEKSLTINRSKKLSELKEELIKLFEISDVKQENCRLRTYQSYNDVPGTPYDETDNGSLQTLNFHNYKSIMIETKKDDEEFPTFSSDDMMLKVLLMNKTIGTFDAPQHVYVHKDGTLQDFKEVLEKKFSIPLDNQKIFRESYSWDGPPAEELKDLEKGLRMHHRVYEATKIYVENCTGEEDSLALAEIGRLKNIIEVKFNLIDSKNQDQKISVDKTIKLKEFKEQLSKIIGIEATEFKVSRHISYNSELKNEEDTLQECRLADGTSLYLERGAPMKQGEYKISFHKFQLCPDEPEKSFEELFDLTVSEQINIGDLKKQLSEELKTKKEIDIPADRMRIREMFTKTPSKIYWDSTTLKECTKCLYNGKMLAIQQLDEEESVTSDQDLVPFIQKWNPSTYTVDERTEIVVTADTPLEEFKKLLAEKYGIEEANVGLAKALGGGHQAPDLLEIPELSWNKQVQKYSGSKSGTLSTAPYYLRDGDLVYFRDDTEELKELTKEEKEKYEKENNIVAKKKYSTGGSYYRKEKALKIDAGEEDYDSSDEEEGEQQN